jgi:hypothetical protein
MRFTALIILSCFFLSCSGKRSSFESEESFQAYLNDPDNGFIESASVGDFRWDVKMTPTLDEDKDNEVSFNLRIQRKDGGSVLDYGGVPKDVALTREGFLSFDIKDQVYLECNDKIIPCAFHHYERNYGLKPSVDLVFHFSGVKPEQDVYFVYRDELFQQGLIRIKFNKELFKTYHVQKK